MDIKDKLKDLLHKRGWTEYRLAKESGLSESTIANIYRRNSTPSFTTLKAICDAFGITLSQFFAEGDMIDLTPETRELFEGWKTLSAEQKDATLQMIKAINHCKR